MKITNVNGVNSAFLNPQEKGVEKDTLSGPIQFTQNETDPAKKTQAKIDLILYNLEYTANHPNIPEARRAEAQAKVDLIKNIRSKVDYTVNPDGSVSFTFKDNVNVEDLKIAFGIEEGELRPYLKQRHKAGVESGSVCPEILTEKNGNVYTFDDYLMDNSAAEAAVDMTKDFEKEFSSTLEYSDGYIRSQDKGWFNVNNDVGDYRKMTLGPGDNGKLLLPAEAFTGM